MLLEAMIPILGLAALLTTRHSRQVQQPMKTVNASAGARVMDSHPPAPTRLKARWLERATWAAIYTSWLIGRNRSAAGCLVRLPSVDSPSGETIGLGLVGLGLPVVEAIGQRRFTISTSALMGYQDPHVLQPDHISRDGQSTHTKQQHAYPKRWRRTASLEDGAVFRGCERVPILRAVLEVGHETS